MSEQQINPIPEPQPTKNNWLMSKFFMLLALIGVSFVATLFVRGVVEERQSLQVNAEFEISKQWSPPQVIAGPVMTVPIELQTINQEGEMIITSSVLTLLPEQLSYTGDVQTQVLTRGVYELPVYDTTIHVAGSFAVADAMTAVPPGAQIRWDKALVSINITDTRGITAPVELTFAGGTQQFEPASDFLTIGASGIHAEVAVDTSSNIHPFSFKLPVKGSQEIQFMPLGKNTTIVLKSDWSEPSFSGDYLPSVRNVTTNGFEATWNITSYDEAVPLYWLSDSFYVPTGYDFKSINVGLHQTVDFYTMIDRATKYSLLFIGLTFLTFFMYELLVGLKVHPMQYTLVGLAIALFYLLLLSFAEVIGFFLAYVGAVIATTTLITAYCASTLKAKRRAVSIGVLLLALYGYLYILLQLDQYSLLFGSVLLFGVLATVMNLTKDLDWYSLNK